MSEKQGKIYICRYGQTDINLCPLMDEECDFRHDCDLRQVVDYDTYQAKEQECERLKEALNKLVPILKEYADVTIGEKQADGTYKFDYDKNRGGLTIIYNPTLAIKGLNIINKVKGQ